MFKFIIGPRAFWIAKNGVIDIDFFLIWCLSFWFQRFQYCSRQWMTVAMNSDTKLLLAFARFFFDNSYVVCCSDWTEILQIAKIMENNTMLKELKTYCKMKINEIKNINNYCTCEMRSQYNYVSLNSLFLVKKCAGFHTFQRLYLNRCGIRKKLLRAFPRRMLNTY